MSPLRRKRALGKTAYLLQMAFHTCCKLDDVEQQICGFWVGKICRKYENFWNSLTHFSLLHQAFIYRSISPGTDHSRKKGERERERKSKKARTIHILWRECSLMTSHTSLIILQNLKISVCERTFMFCVLWISTHQDSDVLQYKSSWC